MKRSLECRDSLKEQLTVLKKRIFDSEKYAFDNEK